MLPDKFSGFGQGDHSVELSGGLSGRNQYDFSGYVSFDKFFGSFHLLKKRYVLMMVLRKGIMFGHMWAKNFHWKSSGTIHFPFRFTLIMMAKICSL
jgi:hypothetical protein